MDKQKPWLWIMALQQLGRAPDKTTRQEGEEFAEDTAKWIFNEMWHK